MGIVLGGMAGACAGAMLGSEVGKCMAFETATAARMSGADFEREVEDGQFIGMAVGGNAGGVIGNLKMGPTGDKDKPDRQDE